MPHRYVEETAQLDCAGHQEVSRCHIRGESQGTCNVTHTPPLTSNKAEPIKRTHVLQKFKKKNICKVALKPRGNITRSPRKGIGISRFVAYYWLSVKECIENPYYYPMNKMLLGTANKNSSLLQYSGSSMVPTTSFKIFKISQISDVLSPLGHLLNI